MDWSLGILFSDLPEVLGGQRRHGIGTEEQASGCGHEVGSFLVYK